MTDNAALKATLDSTRYSNPIKGHARNYDWPVQFDLTDGFLGINQSHDGLLERVLLSPAQVTALLKFLRKRP